MVCLVKFLQGIKLIEERLVTYNAEKLDAEKMFMQYFNNSNYYKAFIFSKIRKWLRGL